MKTFESLFSVSGSFEALYDYFVCTHGVTLALERVTLDDLDKAYKRCCELLGAEMPPEIDPFPVIEPESIPPFKPRQWGELP